MSVLIGRAVESFDDARMARARADARAIGLSAPERDVALDADAQWNRAVPVVAQQPRLGIVEIDRNSDLPAGRIDVERDDKSVLPVLFMMISSDGGLPSSRPARTRAVPCGWGGPAVWPEASAVPGTSGRRLGCAVPW
ncbi:MULTISPECIES: hypothetical protein [Pseudonocardiaceae]|uniref:hypothetical protein n=1 Tax=Pseudonocardiaceae TaxID=2070 RepID=UPI00117EB3ED|nr:MULTISPECIES: hypothetical protein [Pseudonocardiaceae]